MYPPRVTFFGLLRATRDFFFNVHFLLLFHVIRLLFLVYEVEILNLLPTAIGLPGGRIEECGGGQVQILWFRIAGWVGASAVGTREGTS